MICPIPSLVPIPRRSYGKLALTGTAVCCIAVPSALLLVASVLRGHMIRSLEAAQAPIRLQLHEVITVLNHCEEYLSLGEKLLYRRKLNSDSFREPAIVLDALQRALPSDAWIESFSLSKNTVELVVKVNSEHASISVVDRLRDTSRFSEARVDSVESDHGDGNGMFTLRVRAKTYGLPNTEVRAERYENS